MFYDILPQEKTASALESLGLSGNANDLLLSSAMLSSELGRVCLPSPTVPPIAMQYRIGGYSVPNTEMVSQTASSDYLSAILRQESLRDSLFSRSLPFQNPLEPLSAESIKQGILFNEAYKRGQEESLLRLLHSGALTSSMHHEPMLPKELESASTSREESPEKNPQESSLKSCHFDVYEALTSTVERRKNNAPYFDASSLDDPVPLYDSKRKTRGGVTEPFPEKLHRMLKETEESGESDLVSFFPHGRAFAIHHVERFCREIMPRYFKQSRLSSFQRQLNLYGFIRIAAGPDTGGYYHELFLKGRPALAIRMRRVGIPKPAGSIRNPKSSACASAPDFYSMAPVKDSDAKLPAER
jgi:HSF-type DNA-binding